MIRGWPASKVAGYIAYADAEGPFWGARQDVHAGLIAHAAYTAAGRNVPLADLIPDWGGPPEPTLIPWADGVRILTGKG